MASAGHIEVEVRPTVTLESAVACAYMLNLFLDGNDDYALHVGEDGRVRLCATGFIREGEPVIAPPEDTRCPQAVLDRLHPMKHPNFIS